MSQSSKKYLHRYCLQCVLLFISYMAIAIYLIWFHRSVWSFLVCLALLFPYQWLVSFFYNKDFLGILTNEQDAQKFYDAIYQKPMRPPLICRLNAEWYVGNYEKLIALSSAGLKHSKNVRVKCDCLVYLARSYFDLRDVENLTKTVRTFDQLQKENPQKQELFSHFTVFQYYKAYVDRDFEQCISLAEERIKKCNTDNPSERMRWLTQRINCAVAYYEHGDLDKAIEIFVYFVEKTPKLKNFCDLSQKYLTAIEKKDDTILAPVVCAVNTDQYEQELASLKKAQRKQKIITCVCVVLAIAMLIRLGYTEFSDNKWQEQYEDELNHALAEYDQDCEWLSYFWVYKDDLLIDCFVVVQSGDGIDLLQYGEYITADGGTENACVLAQDNILNGEAYCVEAILDGYYIGFSLTNDKATIPSKTYVCQPITINGTKHWFYIDYIETTPRG